MQGRAMPLPAEDTFQPVPKHNSFRIQRMRLESIRACPSQSQRDMPTDGVAIPRITTARAEELCAAIDPWDCHAIRGYRSYLGSTAYTQKTNLGKTMEPRDHERNFLRRRFCVL